MADRKLRVLIVGDSSSLQKELTKSEKATEKTAKHMGGLQKAAGGAALAIGGGLAIAAKIGFDELKQGQLVAAQTEAVIKSTGGAANVTAGHIDELAGSLLKKSGVDDEAIASGENLLLTFTNIRNEAGKGNDIFDQTTKAALDMSVAMGTDMTSAAQTLGKALNDPTTGLSKLTKQGVTFTDAQKKQIAALQAAGDTMGAQKIILQELTTEFGGSAEAAGKTLAGQVNIAKESFSNMTAELVEQLLPAMTLVVSAASSIVGWLSEHKTIAKILIGVLGTLAGILVTVAAVTKVAAAMQVLLNIAMAENPIGLIVIGIAALVAGLILLWQNSETFRNIVTGAFDAVKTAANEMVTVFQFVLDFVKHHWPEIATLLAGPFAPLVALATDAFGIRSGLITAFNAILDAAQTFGGLLVDLIKAPINLLISAWNKLGIPGFTAFGHTFGGFNLPDIPYLDKGGTIARTGLAVVHQGETVVPAGRSMTVEVHQHFNGPPTGNGQREARYARMAAQAAFDGGL